MLRKLLPVAALLAASVACVTLSGPGQPTESPGSVATAAAQTATALAPTVPAGPTGAPPTEAPTGAPPAETPTAEPTAEAFACIIAYADAGSVFCLGDDGTPQVLATGSQPFDVKLSSDGQRAAFQTVVEEGITQLWVVSAAGGDARVIVENALVPNADPTLINSAGYFEWLAGTHTLLFDTRYIPTGGPFGPGEYINADLWTVDADSGLITAVLAPGAAGAFRASPDGHTVAIARPEGLDLVNADGTNYRQNVITFPSIITYSEYQYKPLPQWGADGTFFNVAIPSFDPMAPDANVDLYRIAVDGTVQPLANLAANVVFGGGVNPPRFSPDGRYAVYSQGQPDGSGDVLHLVEFLPEGGVGDRALAPQPALQGWGWAPDSQRFAYTVIPGGPGGQGYVTGVTAESIEPFAAGLTALRALEWQDAATLVFLGQINNGGWGLYRQTLGSEPALLAAGLGEGATMDVR
jgi:hypothetical protein